MTISITLMFESAPFTEEDLVKESADTIAKITALFPENYFVREDQGGDGGAWMEVTLSPKS
jgi:hypothetical protein